MKSFFSRYWKLIVSWLLIGGAIYVGLHFRFDKKIVTFGVVVFGLLSQAFAGLLALIALVPVVGPLIAKVVTIPLVWVANGFAYIVTLLVLKKGHKIDIFKSRVLVTTLLIGVILGFILGKLL